MRLLWYINPETGATTVYHGRQVSHVGPDKPLDGRDVLPGFQLRLCDLLDEVAEGTAEGEE